MTAFVPAPAFTHSAFTSLEMGAGHIAFISGVKENVTVIGRIELNWNTATTPVPSCCVH